MQRILRSNYKVLTIFLFLISAVRAQQYLISTLAGAVPAPTPSKALDVSVSPALVASDAAGNIYFVSGPAGANVVYKIDTLGIVTRIAGTARPPSSEPTDGSIAVNTPLPVVGLACDSVGQVYISDLKRVLKVTPSEALATVAGLAANDSGDGGPALSAGFLGTLNLAFDAAGNLYVADAFKISPGGVISTIAGNGKPGYSGDGGPATAASLSQGTVSILTADSAGNVYFVAPNEVRVRKVSAAGIITTAAGNGSRGLAGDGGPATAAQLQDPEGLAVDNGGDLYIADSGRIRRVSATGTIATVAGGTLGYSGDGGPASAARFSTV